MTFDYLSFIPIERALHGFGLLVLFIVVSEKLLVIGPLVIILVILDLVIIIESLRECCGSELVGLLNPDGPAALLSH
jgi:hypothetical protein